MRTIKRKVDADCRTKLGLELEQAALDILAHLKGEKKFPSRKIKIPEPHDAQQVMESGEE